MEKIRHVLSEYRWRIREIHLGPEESDKHFYVIRRHADQAGLFSFVATNLGFVRLAVSQGYIPVIDMQNSPNPMLAPDEVGYINAWDRYFLPPCGYRLSDICRAHNVTLGSIHPPENEYYPDYRMLQNPKELVMWRQTANQYLHLRPEIEHAINAYCTDVLHLQKERVLGVLCRGTDYVIQKPYNHPIQPRVDVVIDRCREVLARQNCSRIYLCTEDEELWNAMDAAFPEFIYGYQNRRFSLKNNENINEIGNKSMDPYTRNLDYLSAIGILSRCQCLVAGAAGGTYGALLLTKGYDYEYVFQLGRYVTQEPLPGTVEYMQAML